MRAMVYCAGLGSRLAPLTDVTPKPALPVRGRPLIAHTLEWLGAAGISEVFANTHHLAAVMKRVLRESLPAGMSLTVSHEPVLLGTGGGLCAAKPHFGPVWPHDPLLVVNGDALIEAEPTLAADLVRSHAERRPLATLWLSSDARAQALANVDVDDRGAIVRIAGQGAESAARTTRTTYLGLQVVDDRFIEWVAEHLPSSGVGCVKDHGWIPALQAGHAIDGLDLGGITWDIGTPERYAAVNAQKD
jgi:NDP-sugar pyrophosphorylase family protein